MMYPPHSPRPGEPLEARWGAQLIQWIKDSVIPRGDGRTTRVDGNIISVRNGGGVAEDKDKGPFAVTIEDLSENGDSPRWVVRLHNTASESGVAGMLTIGSRRVSVNDQEWEPKTGVVILDITYDDEAEDYTAIFSLEETLPETVDEKRYILRIAEISYDSDTESWSAAQIHPVGDIEVLGRWVK